MTRQIIRLAHEKVSETVCSDGVSSIALEEDSRLEKENLVTR